MSNLEKAKINYILVCDDLREEKDSNKFTLLGLYSGKLRMDVIPAILPKIAIRICIRDVKIGSTMKIDLIRPDGTLIGGGPIRIEAMEKSRGEAFVNLIFAPFPVDAPGPYKLVLTQGEKKNSMVAFEAELKAPK